MRNRKGYVYFVRPIGMLAPVKIGFSDNPKTRLETLASWSPFPLEVAAKIEATAPLEYKFHSRFRHVHSHREWFLADPDLIYGIEMLQAGKPVEEAFDLSIVKVPRPVRKRNYSPEQRMAISYNHKVRHMIVRLEKKLGERRVVPEDICDFLWGCREGLSQEQIARLEEFLADPEKHAVTLEQRWPKAASTIREAA